MPSVGTSQVFNDGQAVGVLGAKLYYADGTVSSIPLDAVNGAVGWVAALGTGVQAMNVYFDRTYQLNNGGVLQTARYKRTLVQYDYYWASPTQGFGAGMAGEPPLDAVNKLGSVVTEAEFYAIYNVAFEDRAF